MSMSTQSHAGVNFSIAGELQPCRLLELPPDLVEYMTSSDSRNLHFKASDASDAESYLCTADKTFAVRQVHTSNTVYITTPSSDATGVTAISQCSSALEALPTPAQHAKSTLRSLLASFGEPQDLELSSSRPRTKENVFAHTPMSNAECQSVWTDLTAFEHSGQSYRPTATALVKTWKWLLEIAYANAINLAARSLQKQSLELMLEGEDEWPRQLVDAILLKLVHPDDSSFALQREATVSWVGRSILEARQHDVTQSTVMDKTAFLAAWRDALPEDWRNLASLDMLGNSYKLSASKKHIEFAQDRLVLGEDAGADASKPAATAAAAVGKRKWHEKFAAARKQGKTS